MMKLIVGAAIAIYSVLWCAGGLGIFLGRHWGWWLGGLALFVTGLRQLQAIVLQLLQGSPGLTSLHELEVLSRPFFLLLACAGAISVWRSQEVRSWCSVDVRLTRAIGTLGALAVMMIGAFVALILLSAKVSPS